MTWYRKSAEDVLSELDADRQGLTESEAESRLRHHGTNEIEKGQEISAWQVLIHQFTSPLIYVLLGALAVTLSIQSWADAIVIGAVLVINATVGFIQEYQAESAVQSLMEMITPKAIVVREGERRQIDSKKLVPGDIVFIDAGRMIPADVRLLEVQALQVNESALTGESEPVNKHGEPLEDAAGDLTTADQTNMAFMGTAVTSGEAQAVVVATGKKTKIGEIAEEVQKAGQIQTPLERRIRRLTKWITIVILLVAAVSSTIGWLVGRDLVEMVLLGVALAVAAIPAGLPIVVTVALALGVNRMARRHAVIRNLPAVDTLGSTTVIISDKTGTITQNQMTVRRIFAGQKHYRVSGDAFSLSGRISHEDSNVEVAEKTPLWYALMTGCLCNDATVHGLEDENRQQEQEEGTEKNAKSDELRPEGDPMEVALLFSAVKAGIDRRGLEEKYPRQKTVPFKTERRFMATFHEAGEGEAPLVLVKGAPEKIISMCASQLGDEKEESEIDGDRLVEESERLAGEGLRVLAMAFGRGEEVAEAVGSDRAGDLIFVGLQGMLDPPRRSAVEAIDDCHNSGIRVVMVTGDHGRTASAIAAKIHLDQPVSQDDNETQDEEVREKLLQACTGQDIKRLEDDEFDATLDSTNVFARVEPLQKLRLVDRLKEKKEIVAVTGDGVNDAPALKTAHIGAAMGAGTDVAKDASDMVITDNNFASVYAAVREGRTAFRNIRMATFFLLSTGAADILIILSALVAGWPLPLLPAQILWCNVVTNGIADVALAFEPGERALYERRPRPPGEGVLNSVLLERLVLVGIWLAAGTLAMFWWKSGGGSGNLDEARTAALTTLVLFQKVHVFNCRSESVSVFKKSLMKNKLLFLGVMASLGIHVAALYIPLTQELLRFTPLSGLTWAAALGIAATAIIVNELHKRFRTPRR